MLQFWSHVLGSVVLKCLQQMNSADSFSVFQPLLSGTWFSPTPWAFSTSTCDSCLSNKLCGYERGSGCNSLEACNPGGGRRVGHDRVHVRTWCRSHTAGGIGFQPHYFLVLGMRGVGIHQQTFVCSLSLHRGWFIVTGESLQGFGVILISTLSNYFKEYILKWRPMRSCPHPSL